jgi:phospholipid/cholesterol/gamma-HCH transport system ATP-binding protein
VVIIGRSGGGKSILLKHLIGLLQPDSGTIRVDGEDITTMNERSLLRVRRKYGMLFQMAALFDSLTVEENVGFVLRRQGVESDAEIRRRVAEALEMVELPGIGHKMPSELSGGMRKRVGLARAIVYRPEIVLYDEPTTGLDPIAADNIDRLIRRVWETLHVTSIAVTHDMKSARTISNRILMLHEGRIYSEGPSAEILESTDPVIHRFVNGISTPRNLNE